MIKNLYIAFVSLCLMLGATSCVEKVEYGLKGGDQTDQPDPIDIPTEDGEVVTEGHVDLGLSVEWAACNLGASLPQDGGTRYYWGDQSDNCELDICGTSYDQATVELGKDWQLPSLDQARELINKCRWTQSEYRGEEGFIVTGPSKKAIFLRGGTYYYYHVYYWTGTCDVKTNKAYAIDVETQSIYLEDRNIKYYIRPVYVGK